MALPVAGAPTTAKRPAGELVGVEPLPDYIRSLAVPVLVSSVFVAGRGVCLVTQGLIAILPAPVRPRPGWLKDIGQRHAQRTIRRRRRTSGG